MIHALRTLVLLLACVACVAGAAPGDLDPTFGDHGKRHVGNVPETFVQAMIQMADERLLVLIDGYLWRLNADASPDPTFAGGSGVFDSGVLAQPGLLFFPKAIAGSDAAGRTVVAIGEAGSSGDFVSVARVLADGTLDRSFGVNGMGRIRVTDNSGSPAGAVIQADGRILVAGNAQDFSSGERPAMLARFLANGAPDTSFGDNGYLRLQFNALLIATAQQPDGKLIVAGRDFGTVQVPSARTVLWHDKRLSLPSWDQRAP